MAKRNVYRVSDCDKKYIEEIEIDFKWYPGFALSQKQKSIFDLHSEYNKVYKKDKVLEISSKSQKELGRKLSAFNLMITAKDGKCFSVESAFQSSKKFEFGGPYLDILEKSSREAKKDSRLKDSGKLISFQFYGVEWPLEPKTIFYDWLYIRAVYKNEDLANKIIEYDAFTDIEFNPNRSINCQAKSAALFVALSKRNLLEKSMNSIEDYFDVILNNNKKREKKIIAEQMSFL